jgi:argininosuccinate lyase
MSDSMVGVYGLGGSLSQKPADILIRSAYRHDCLGAEVLLEHIGYADMAHALVLIEVGVIPPKSAAQICQALMALQEIPPTEFPINPELGDIYNSREHELEARIGVGAGWLHAGRPRREAVNIGYLMIVRQRLLRLMQAQSQLLRAFIAKAEQNKSTLMTDFTYLHHAHPTTFAHYILTFAYPMIRDIDRLLACFRRFNASPAGSGSVNGTRLPLNRDRLAELLGFESVIAHTRDAMWQPDLPIEAGSALVALMINLDRFAEELQIWSTSEFNYVSLPDSLSRSSVIMPQKRNPYALAYVRGLAGSLIGKVTGFSAVGKTFSGNPDSRTFIYVELPEAIARVTEVCELFEHIISGMTMNHDAMAESATIGFPFATDLAEYLMLTAGIDFKSAHRLVGRATRIALESGETRLIAAHLERAMLALDLVITIPSDVELANLIEPMAIVSAREGRGGASAAQVDEMILELNKEACRIDCEVNTRLELIAAARMRLLRAVKFHGELK